MRAFSQLSVSFASLLIFQQLRLQRTCLFFGGSIENRVVDKPRLPDEHGHSDHYRAFIELVEVRQCFSVDHSYIVNSRARFESLS